MPRTNERERERMMGGLTEAVARLERAYVAGLHEEYRDDVRAVLDALSAQFDLVGDGDAAELFGMAQLAPGEGIEDAVRRIEAYLSALSALVARPPAGC